MTNATFELQEGWNAAHRILLARRRNIVRAMTEKAQRLGDIQQEAAELRLDMDRFTKDLTEIDEAVYKADFTPPTGFDIWGDAIPE